jgi:alpha-L-rhamnosidase
VFFPLIAARASLTGSSLAPFELQCDHRTEPLGIDSTPPSLSWSLTTLNPTVRNLRQTSFRILAASSLSQLSRDKADIWDTGRVSSSETACIPYRGKPLRSSQTIFWKVRIWDGTGLPSGWSAPASWATGVLFPSDWHGKWIAGPKLSPPSSPSAQNGPATVLLRRNFDLSKLPARTFLRICGLGQYEVYLNGSKVGNDILSPGWTDYRKTCLYDSFDVTKKLHVGPNSIAIFLGAGMYNVVSGRYTKFTGSFGQLKAIAQLSTASGCLLATDRSWKMSPGPITFSSPYGGEDFDARLEPAGWKQPGFNDSAWRHATETAGPGGELRGSSESAPPIRTFETLSPQQIRRISIRTFVVDLGQNASIMPRLVVSGPAGASVKITPAELVNPDGTVDRESVGGGQAYWKYTLNGRQNETYFPYFFYQGARYLQVELTPPPSPGKSKSGTDQLPNVVSLSAKVIHSDSPPVGTFSCSNPLFNKIDTLVKWAQKSNIVSLLTDCPHRERLGWLEQTHLNGPALRYNFDLTNLFSKIENDMADAQLPNGFVPDIAPEFVNFGSSPSDLSNPFRNSPEWGSAFILVPWQQYEFAGDVRILRLHFEEMKRYVQFLKSQAKNQIVDFGLGDWYDIGPNPPGFSQLTPRALTATAFYFADSDIVAKCAHLLGKESDAHFYRKQAAEIRAAYNAKFYNPSSGEYGAGSQCANAISLVMGLVQPSNRARVLNSIVSDVRSKGLTAGDVGYRYLLLALSEEGRSDVVYEMNNQSDRPGYGYQLKMGATSLTEAWNAGRSSSQNHFMLGQIEEWFYRGLGGIQNAPNSAGFQHIEIKPAFLDALTRVDVDYLSAQGMIRSHWKRQGNHVALHIVVPPNTHATVLLPTKYSDRVFEGGKPARVSPGVRLSLESPIECEFEVGSGNYVFSFPLPRPLADQSSRPKKSSPIRAGTLDDAIRRAHQAEILKSN